MVDMKRILMIAPSSYPVTSAECIVNIKLLQAMSRNGQFEIDLVSKDLHWHDYPSDSLEKLGVRVRNCHIVSVDNRITVRAVWQHFLCLVRFGIVFKGTHWNAAAFPIVRKLVRENRYDYVLTKNESSFLLGYWLKKRTGLKWVATWNDPYPKSLYPDAYLKYWDIRPHRVDGRVIDIMRRYADVHIFPNSRLRDYMIGKIKADAADAVVVPHVVLSSSVLPRRNNGVLRIIHSGNINYPRDPELFLTALKRLTDTVPDVRIELSILGVTGNDLNEKISRHGLTDYVRTIPPVSYGESIAMLADYDVALIVEADCREGIFLPTKVSDFMQSGIPIFAVSPAIGVMNDLYSGGKIPYFALNTDSDDIFQSLKKLYGDYLNGSIPSNSIPEPFTEESVINQYLSF